MHTSIGSAGSQTLVTRVDRRTLLRIAVAAAVGGPLAAACAPALPPALSPQRPSASTPSARVNLPTHSAIEVAKPDLPATESGLDAAYFAFPQNLVKSVQQPPASGGDINVFTLLQIQPPPPVDQNPAWQAVNKDVNANMKMVMASNPDYPAKLATTIAGNDLPDLLYLLASVSVPNIPQFLSGSYTDITQHVGGDAVKDYPNLAALPTIAWKQTVYNNAIYGVPVSRPFFQQIWYINQDRLDAIGGKQPTSADEFKRMLVALTRPQDGSTAYPRRPITRTA
jgi:putative aldouronate transport system substrate-binding protein